MRRPWPARKFPLTAEPAGAPPDRRGARLGYTRAVLERRILARSCLFTRAHVAFFSPQLLSHAHWMGDLAPCSWIPELREADSRTRGVGFPDSVRLSLDEPGARLGAGVTEVSAGR